MTAAAEIAGQRFGRLTAVEPLAKYQTHSHGIEWRFICTCGGWAIRSVAGIRTSVKKGQEPMCSQCRSRQRRQYWSEMHRSRRAHEEYGLHHTIFGRMRLTADDVIAMMEWRLLDDIREALAEAFGPIITLEFTNEQIDPAFYDPP